jgi:hypothetical protein
MIMCFWILVLVYRVCFVHVFANFVLFFARSLVPVTCLSFWACSFLFVYWTTQKKLKAKKARGKPCDVVVRLSWQSGQLSYIQMFSWAAQNQLYMLFLVFFSRHFRMLEGFFFFFNSATEHNSSKCFWRKQSKRDSSLVSVFWTIEK